MPCRPHTRRTIPSPGRQAWRMNWTVSSAANFGIDTWRACLFAHALTHVTSALPFSFLSEKLVVVLRDGRNLIGLLRSFDQFGELLFSDAVLGFCDVVGFCSGLNLVTTDS
jgi:hypothetical protein